MEGKNCLLSPLSRKRLATQGYLNYTDKELYTYRFGIRLAYALCSAIVLSGLVLQNIHLLIMAAAVAFLGTIPPYHPFDYIYNYGIRYIINQPKLPPRTIQGRFACGIAATWLLATILFLYTNHDIIGYIFGGILLVLATLVSTTDICIPSMIYNAIFGRRKRKTIV